MALSINKIRGIAFFAFVALQGCHLSKITTVEMGNSYYICNKGEMVGNTTLLLKDSIFVFTERGGLYKGEGKWEISSDGEYLVLNGVSKLANSKNSDMDLMQEIHLKLKIKGKEKLISDECVFIRVAKNE